MNYPSELKYTKDHEWLKINNDGTATIGITDFAQSELGDIVFVEISDKGTEVMKDESFGTVEAVKTVSELYMPVNGTIIEINPDLDANPELVNDDPYGRGWMIKISVTTEEQLNDLLTASEYEKLIA